MLNTSTFKYTLLDFVHWYSKYGGSNENISYLYSLLAVNVYRKRWQSKCRCHILGRVDNDIHTVGNQWSTLWLQVCLQNQLNHQKCKEKCKEKSAWPQKAINAVFCYCRSAAKSKVQRKMSRKVQFTSETWSIPLQSPRFCTSSCLRGCYWQYTLISTWSGVLDKGWTYLSLKHKNVKSVVIKPIDSKQVDAKRLMQYWSVLYKTDHLIWLLGKRVREHQMWRFKRLFIPSWNVGA